VTRAARAPRPPGTAPARQALGGPGRCLAALLVAGALAGGCGTGSDGAVDEVGAARDARNPGVVPTLPGGVDLTPLDPASVLVGAELAFGSPLPSEQAAADAYTEDPEVTAALARRAYMTVDGRRLAHVVVLRLDGTQLFDDSVLRAFEAGAVSALGGAPAAEVQLAGRTVLRAGAAGGPAAIAFREGDLLTLVTGAAPDVELVVTRQLEAVARGEVGSATPATPLVPAHPDAAFVAVPTVAFAPFPPPEDEEPPPMPPLSGTTGATGRYGVVAGERRTIAWAYGVDLASHPTAESLEPALAALASHVAGGAVSSPVETIDRVVHTASIQDEDVRRAASVFRHGGLVLVVEGADAAQVEAVVTAWIAALGPG
jgi:hypothetical protein